MTTLLQDLRFAVRSFVRAPRFTLPAILALAVGIGSTSAIFSVVEGVLLQPLPYNDPDRIVAVWETLPRRNRLRNVVAPANFIEWLERNRSFEYLAMVGPSRQNVLINGQPEEVSGLAASGDLFPALGVQPVLGRAYTAREDERGNDDVIVLGYDYWRSRLGGRADVLGQTLMTNGVPRVILGVMPPDFTVAGQRANFLIPYGWTAEALRSARGRGSSHGIARLRDGVTFEQAQAEMTALMAQLEQEAPQRNTGWTATLVPIHEQTVDEIRPALLVLAGAVGLVLLIACVNVANLLLARSTVRQRELGIRTALGAGRARVLGQMLTESLLLGAAGGVAGLALAFVLHRGLIALASESIPVPRLDQVSLDAPVVAFTIGLSLLTGLVFGVVPALLASAAAGDAMREGGRHGSGPRARRVLAALVVAEVALSLVLLAGAGLLVRSFVRLQQIDPGFRAEGLLTARVQVPAAQYDDDRKIAAFYNGALERISILPGVRAAAGVSFLPLDGLGIGTNFHIDGRPVPPPDQSLATAVRPVTPNFFRTMGLRQLAGRDFTASDTLDAPRVAVISESIARRHFPGENPIGARLHVNVGDVEGGPYEVVGIVSDIKLTSLDAEVPPVVYIPHTQLAIGLLTFVVRTDGDPLSLVSGVAGAVRSLDPGLPLADVRVMEDVVNATLSRPRTIAVLLAAFAVMALMLAGVGVYGVMAYSVAQRTQEIGVRMALGATPESVFRLVLGQALRLVAGGVVIGLLAASVLTRLLESMLYATDPLEPSTFAATALVLVVVAALASYVPARRGTRVAPVEALRAE